MNFKILLQFIALLTNSLWAFGSYAQSIELERCQQEFALFGDGFGHDSVSPKCIELFRVNALSNALYVSDDKKTTAFAYKNMIAIETNKDGVNKIELIAGSSTKIESAVALEVDTNHDEIITLDKSGNIFFFSSKILGNVAPFRILKNTNLQGATNFVISSVLNSIIVLNKHDRKILFLSRTANIHGRTGHKDLKVKRSIHDIASGITAMAVNNDKNELMLLDRINNEVIFYDISSNSTLDLPSKKIKTTPLPTEKHLELKYLQESNQLLIIVDGKVLQKI